ncbi:MAG TPA: helix-turn-helix domain-containing protein [Bacillota bacterium]|nr:helix-turn-helix domain-containing protein [Bacillota bacterium]HQB81600.1 helix-turn-helix domain-containing protein [Bacillota bacterium]
MKAIIVDDELAMTTIIRHFIEKGHLPIQIAGHATNGVEALKLIRQVEPTLIFLDIEMPVMDGFEVMRQEPDRNYIIVTAYDQFAYAQRGLRLGARDILLKPIEYDQLLASIRRSIGWKFTDNLIVNGLLQYIHENYHHALDRVTLSGVVHASPDYISRLFKKYMNVSIPQYINELRINHAAALLETTTHSVHDVCAQVGYKSMNSFYKYFKRYKGCPPASFRDRSLADGLDAGIEP